jgi:hypothetical protein
MKTSLSIAIFLTVSGIASASLDVLEELVDRWIKSKQAG